MARDLDEDDVRVTPGRGSRPRSKVRPSYRSAKQAVVTGVDRGRFACELDDGTVVTAVKSRELGRGGLVVGDRVRLTGVTSGTPGRWHGSWAFRPGHAATAHRR
jgi:ribosome biogenesis GTPase